MLPKPAFWSGFLVLPSGRLTLGDGHKLSFAPKSRGRGDDNLRNKALQILCRLLLRVCTEQAFGNSSHLSAVPPRRGRLRRARSRREFIESVPCLWAMRILTPF